MMQRQMMLSTMTKYQVRLRQHSNYLLTFSIFIVTQDGSDNEAAQDSNNEASENDDDEDGNGQITNDDEPEMIAHPQGRS